MFSVSSSLRARLAAGTALAAAAVALIGAAPASATIADLQVAPPYTAPYGKTYSQYGADWWKFVFSKPAATNPLTDTTGANCGVGQSGPVWFLTGTFPGSGASTRSCTIPFGKAILIPVVNGSYGAFPTDPADQQTPAFVRSQVTPQLKAATDLKASIDGSSVTDPSRFFEESPLFSVTFGADNIFGLPAGQLMTPTADAGYYLVIYPLLPGKHTIKVSGTIPGSGSVDATWKVTTPLFG